MNPLSLATTYIETFFFRADNGQPEPRSYATGFFVRGPDHLFLVTNWHVFSGLDPANPSTASKPPPNYAKLSLRSKDGWIVELTVPLYDEQMQPLWKEHDQRFAVDVVVYPLPPSLAQHFQMVDIRTAAHDKDIAEAVAKDVFVLGYPFSREEMKSSFGDDAPFYLPVWKRGTIASEPRVRLGKKVILIDALSRPGMSGAPVLISEERGVIRLDGANADVWPRLEQGTLSALDAISHLDTTGMSGGMEKRFRLLGVYSGVIGNTRLEQVALGKCWHADVLHELTKSHQPGAMPFHAPLPNAFYSRFLSDLGTGRLTRKDAQGQTTEVVPFR
ncbi:serine protease [Variovorax sp. LjRoot290]|uniref:S1 family peptidase n=1 Tax=Variovorax sp. LjRoot290 TaxID=3342316 RepID=UPI003ED09C21